MSAPMPADEPLLVDSPVGVTGPEPVLPRTPSACG